MTKLNKQNKKAIAWAFFSAAILIELLNIILAFQLGKTQANACPKAALPGQLVILLTVLSIIPAFISAKLAGKYRTIAYLLVSVWVIVLAIGAFFLFIIANGVIDWCNWAF